MTVTRHRTGSRFPWLAVLALVVGLVVGTIFGYSLRGEPENPAPIAIEREVPTVTVTTPE